MTVKSGSNALQQGLAVRIFPATARTFTKDTRCRRMAGARHGMCELVRHGMTGNGMGTARHVRINLKRYVRP
jgi:hypothetical protein